MYGRGSSLLIKAFDDMAVHNWDNSMDPKKLQADVASRFVWEDLQVDCAELVIV